MVKRNLTQRVKDPEVLNLFNVDYDKIAVGLFEKGAVRCEIAGFGNIWLKLKKPLKKLYKEACAKYETDSPKFYDFLSYVKNNIIGTFDHRDELSRAIENSLQYIDDHNNLSKI